MIRLVYWNSWSVQKQFFWCAHNKVALWCMKLHSDIRILVRMPESKHITLFGNTQHCSLPPALFCPKQYMDTDYIILHMAAYIISISTSCHFCHLAKCRATTHYSQLPILTPVTSTSATLVPSRTIQCSLLVLLAEMCGLFLLNWPLRWCWSVGAKSLHLAAMSLDSETWAYISISTWCSPFWFS